jgi:hypothetical protein
MTRLFSWFLPAGASEEEVRGEIWRLGTRHLGEPLQGAIDELGAANLAPGRAVLLRACVRKLQRP